MEREDEGATNRRASGAESSRRREAFLDRHTKASSNMQRIDKSTRHVCMDTRWIVCGDPEIGHKANDTPKDQFFIVLAY